MSLASCSRERGEVQLPAAANLALSRAAFDTLDVVRLGEILVTAQIITAQQLEQALEAQVMLGARLGTCLVELGFIDLDGLSNALAHQHRLPAALASHFDRAETELQLRFAANLAERYACVPLFRVGKRSAVIAATGPLEARSVAIIADELGFAPDRLIVSIAPELRIRYTLERVYNILRPQRFLRAPGAPRAMPATHVFPDVELPRPEEPVAVAPRTWEDTGERRRYVQTLVDPQGDDSAIAIDVDTDVEVIPDDDLPTSVEVIAAGRDREEVASLAIAVIRHLVPATDAVVLFTLRGAVVVSSASFRRDGKKQSSIALPMHEQGAVGHALRTKELVRTGPEPTDIDRRLLSSLGVDGGQLVVAPLVTGVRAFAALVVASRVPVDVAVVETIAGATAAGFARLMREAIE